MAQDYTKDQLDTISRLKTICATILDQIALAKIITQEAIDKGYAPGTPTTGITDALLQSGTPAPFQNLAAADISAATTAITLLDTTLAAASRTGYKALEKMR